MYKTYAENLNQELQALRRFRHDLKKQYFLERMYLETGQYDLLRAEYEKMGAMSFVQGGTSGNLVIDALVSNARKQAENAGIKFTSQIRIPMDLSIQDVHMNRLLGNILENAFEAVIKSDDLDDLSNMHDSSSLIDTYDSDILDDMSEEKWIQLTMQYDRGNLYIRCENSCHHDLNLDFRTTKKQKQEHGMGIAIIKEIASLYDGNVEIECKKSVFSIQVLLLHTYFSRET